MDGPKPVAFPSLARCVVSEGAYRELWAARRLLEAARMTTQRADWQAQDERDPTGRVAKHDLALLEAAVLVASGERAATPDGFPHVGSEVSSRGACDDGCCPCHDGRSKRARQPRGGAR